MSEVIRAPGKSPLDVLFELRGAAAGVRRRAPKRKP